jgi:hypothetical protein
MTKKTRPPHAEAELSYYPEGEEPPKRLLEEGSLWIMVAAPTVWAAHFLLCYWVAAVWCAKVTEGPGPLDTVRIVIAALTLAALALIALLAWHAVRGYGGRLLINEELTEDTEKERARFLGHATLLLCSLSTVAILYSALPALVFDTCF